MTTRFHDKPITSIKLVASIDDERFYQTNYCRGLCSDDRHRYRRLSLTIDSLRQHYQAKSRHFIRVLSIDLTCNNITLHLLHQIKSMCPRVECMFIQETVFEEGAWNFFISNFPQTFKCIGFGNDIRMRINNNISTISDLHSLLEECKTITEFQIFVNELVETDWNQFFQSFRSCVQPFYLYLRHNSNQKCFPNCACTYSEADKPRMKEMEQTMTQISNFNKLLIHLRRKSVLLQFLRIETDVCPTQTGLTTKIVSSFKGLIATKLDFESDLFDQLDRNTVQTIFEPLFSNLDKLESLTERIGSCSVENCLFDIPNPFGVNLSRLKLMKGDLTSRDSDENSIKILINNYANVKRLELNEVDLQTDDIIDLIFAMTKLQKLIIDKSDLQSEEFERELILRKDIKFRRVRGHGLTYSVWHNHLPNKKVTIKLLNTN